MYKVFFEIFGKKMQTAVAAKDENEAKRKVMEKIKFYKIEPVFSDVDKEWFRKEFPDIFNMANP